MSDNGVAFGLIKLLVLVAVACVGATWISALMLVSRVNRSRARLPGFEFSMVVHPFGLYRWLARFSEIAQRDDALRPQLGVARLAQRFYVGGAIAVGLAAVMMVFLISRS